MGREVLGGGIGESYYLLVYNILSFLPSFPRRLRLGYALIDNVFSQVFISMERLDALRYKPCAVIRGEDLASVLGCCYVDSRFSLSWVFMIMNIVKYSTSYIFCTSIDCERTQGTFTLPFMNPGSAL